MRDVLLYFQICERLQVKGHRDTLGELAELLCLQQRAQLGLADQDHVQVDHIGA